MESNESQVQTILKYTFGIVPIVAGLDKFTNILTDWSQYLSPGLIEMLPLNVAGFMAIIGIIEIFAGVLVLYRPRIGGMIVTLWLILIALTLIFSLNHIDVAVRDLVMAVGAFSLMQLSTQSPKLKAKN